jgi:copper resistance protein D
VNLHQLHIALNALDFWALFASVGLLVSRLGLLPARVFADPALGQRWHRSLGLVLATLTLTGLALLVVRSMQMAGSPFMQVLPLLPQVLLQSHFGHIWAIHFGAIAALWAAWSVSRRLPFNLALGFALPAVLVLIFTYSASSHAADQGDFQPAEIIDWVHLLATSVWGGGILATVFLVFPALRGTPDHRRHLTADVIGRLSAMSAFALMAVFLTGLLSAALRLGTFSALFTLYGQILTVKILLVSCMVLIGAINRFLLVPKLQRWAAGPAKDTHLLGRFRLALRIDTLLVLLVLIASAILIQGMPPAAMQNTPALQGHMTGM